MTLITCNTNTYKLMYAIVVILLTATGGAKVNSDKLYKIRLQ